MEKSLDVYTVTAFVVNRSRTKLLLRYCQQTDRWLPTIGTPRPDELAHEAVIRHVFETTGVAATLVSLGAQSSKRCPYALKQAGAGAGGSPSRIEMAYVLEADENRSSQVELEEVYDAQWLTRDEILGCRCVSDSARSFAKLILLADNG